MRFRFIGKDEVRCNVWLCEEWIPDFAGMTELMVSVNICYNKVSDFLLVHFLLFINKTPFLEIYSPIGGFTTLFLRFF